MILHRLIPERFVEPPPVTELEYLRMMDKLRAEITRFEVMYHRMKGKAEQSYWEKKYSEAVHLHMEFEWGLHPQNDEKVVFH